ncbi:MAG TPA: hypothetical protein VJ765_00775 [Chitinophagaceae bacterium]|nr:hypothetical protein [Chitinophagaceae bacterium]
MEVHHHSHSARKKWTHYFWEFLMLFLAVFCGFLAEYQLEHKIEKNRENQFMQTMVEDLLLDTAVLRYQMKLADRQISLLDSLVDLLNNQQISDDNITRLYMLAANSGRVVNMPFENRTSSQLKNAGGMRLIRKKEIADSVLLYWRGIEICEGISQRLEGINEDRSNLAGKLFHNKYYIHADEPFASVTGTKPDGQLINKDPRMLAEYSNSSYRRKNVLNVYKFNMQHQKDRAIRLMQQIREAYYLE